MEDDEGAYICNVTILETSEVESVVLENLLGEYVFIILSVFMECFVTAGKAYKHFGTPYSPIMLLKCNRHLKYTSVLVLYTNNVLFAMYLALSFSIIKKPSMKADLAICSQILDVSG